MMGSSTVQSLVWGPNVAQKQIYFWPLTYFFTIFKASLINHFFLVTHSYCLCLCLCVFSPFPSSLRFLIQQHLELLHTLQERVLKCQWQGIMGDVFMRLTSKEVTNEFNNVKSYFSPNEFFFLFF